VTSATRSTCALLSLMSCSQLGLIRADADVTCRSCRQGTAGASFLTWVGVRTPN
jgi:hypothetical protein